MTREEAIELLEKSKHKPQPYKYMSEAIDMAIKALEKIGHLTDRPCSACEFHSDNGCCKWSCVFEGGDAE